MPRRERNVSRRSATRAQRESILIVCGAEKTEIHYLQGLRDHLESASIDIAVVEKRSAPDQVVAFARDYVGSKDFDERWCVVDVDRFEREGRKVSAAAELAGECGAYLVVSNPCFEFWLLLHYADRRPLAIVCRDIEAVLRGYVPGYDKTRLKFADFVDGISDALQRAKKIDPSGTDHAINPSTGMWRLVERILR